MGLVEGELVQVLINNSIAEYNGRKRELLNEGATKSLLAKEQNKTNGLVSEVNGKHKTGGNRVQASDLKRVKPPSIIFNLFKMFRCELIIATMVKMVADTLQFANPFLLRWVIQVEGIIEYSVYTFSQLIGYVSDPNAQLWQGILYALTMFFVSELRSFLINHYFFIMFRMGIRIQVGGCEKASSDVLNNEEQIQTSLTTAVYKKTLRLSNSARRDRTVGEIVSEKQKPEYAVKLNGECCCHHIGESHGNRCREVAADNLPNPAILVIAVSNNASTHLPLQHTWNFCTVGDTHNVNIRPANSVQFVLHTELAGSNNLDNHFSKD